MLAWGQMEHTFEDSSDRQAPGSPEARAQLPLESDGAKESWSTRLTLSAFAILGFALPIAAYFSLIDHYGVNTPYADEWYNVDLIRQGLSFSALWHQHAEHRVFVPNLIVLLLARTTHFNILVEEYLSGVMLCVAIVLLILADKRSSPSTPWIYYCPVALVSLSFVQVASTLFGFQLSWYLAILAFAVALFLLDRTDLTKLGLAGAIAAAVVGSLSAFEGLFIWPIGLVVLYHRRCPRGLVLAWIAAAAVTGAAYFHNYSFEGNSYWITHPTLAIRFFFLAIGDVVGAQLPDPHTGNVAVLVLGVVIFAVACWVIVTRGLRRGKPTDSSVGVALIGFGLLFVATFTAGRVNGGLYVAGTSQYTTFDLMIVTGCYLALLNPSRSQLKAARRSERLAWPILRMVMAGVMLLTIVFGTINGLTFA